jgi:hypothetical protein
MSVHGMAPYGHRQPPVGRLLSVTSAKITTRTRAGRPTSMHLVTCSAVQERLD